MKLKDLTTDQINLIDKVKAQELKTAEPPYDIESERNAPRQRAILESVKVSHATLRTEQPGQNQTRVIPTDPSTIRGREFDTHDLAMFAITRPHLAEQSESDREQQVRRLERQENPEPTEDSATSEQKVDSFIRNLEAFEAKIYPKFTTRGLTHFLKPNMEAHLFRHISTDMGNPPKKLKHLAPNADPKPAIVLIMRVKRGGEPYWVVSVHGEEPQADEPKFYLYKVENPKDGGDRNFKKSMSVTLPYELGKHNNETAAVASDWTTKPVIKPYDEHYDGTYRVSITPAGFTKPDGNFMEPAYKEGIKKILEYKNRKSDADTIEKLSQESYISAEGIPGLAMAYHQPEGGGAFKVLVVAPMRIIDALPDKGKDRGDKEIRITKQRLENAQKIIDHLNRRVKEIKKTHRVAPKFNAKTEQTNLELVWKMFASKEEAWQQQPLNDNFPYLFVSSDYKLVSSAVYKGVYRGPERQRASTDSDIVKEYDIKGKEELKRTFWIINSAPANGVWTKSAGATAAADIERFINYPPLNLTEKSKKANSNSSKSSPKKKFAKQKKSPVAMKSETAKVASSSEEKKEVAKTRGDEIASWWKDEFSFQETRKALNRSHSGQGKGFWEGTGATLYDYFWTKVDYRKVAMDALACLMNGQIGQSFNNVMNDWNVLKGQYDEYSDYFGSDEWTSKSTGEKWEAIPAFFYPDDLPIDDMSAEFIDTLREGVSSLINQLMLTAAQGILDSLINFCERPNVDIPDPTDRLPTPDFNFDRLGDLIQALYDGLVTPEELSNLLEDLATQLSPLELCALLEGDPPAHVVDKAMEIVRLHCIKWIETEDQLVDFFASIGENLDLSVCDDIRGLEDKAPVDEEYLCPPDRTITRRVLGEKGLSEKEIKQQLEEQRQKRREQAEALMEALKDGILSGNFEVPNVFCQKDEEGNVKQGTVSFFDDQFKFVTKETVEHIFSSTYNNFQSEGFSFPQSLMSEQPSRVSCAPYVRTRSKSSVNGDHYAGDVVLRDIDGSTEEVISSIMITDARKPFPYLVDFYRKPDFMQEIRPRIHSVRIPFAFNFLSQLQGMANEMNGLREDMSNTSTASNREDCDTSDQASDLQELIDNISSGINENSKSTHVIFEERYGNDLLITTPLDCAGFAEGLIYDQNLEDCVCDEANGYIPDPENPDKCIKVVERPPENPVIEQSSDDRCEPPAPAAEVQPPPPPPPPSPRPQPQAQPVDRSVEKQVQYVIKITGNNQYPTTAYSYEKKVPDKILDYIESRDTSDYSSSNVFKFVMEDIVEQSGADRELAERTANILINPDNNTFITRFRGAIIEELFGLLGKGDTAPYLKSQSQSDEGSSKSKYVVEQINLGPMPNEVCDPHLLKIRQVLEDMFDELGNNMCLDLHAEKNLDEDGLPRLKPLEEAAMSACIKVTLRHYLIENITRGLMTHSTFLKIGDDMSDLKYGYIFGKMKLAMESYGEEYYKNFSKYALKVYKGPKLKGKGPKSKLAIIHMMKKEYAEISYGLHQALFLGDISSGRTRNANKNFFANMFNDITRDSHDKIIIYKEVDRGLGDTLVDAQTDQDIQRNTFFQSIYDENREQEDFSFESDFLLNQHIPYRCNLAGINADRIYDNLTKNITITFAIEKSKGGARLVAIVPEPLIHPDQANLMRISRSNNGNIFRRVLFTKYTRAFQGSRHYSEDLVASAIYSLNDHRQRATDNSAYGIVIPLYTMNYPGQTIKDPLMDWWDGEPIQAEGSNQYDNEIVLQGWSDNQDDFSESMSSSDSLKTIFEYCFPVREYASMINIHEMETNMKNIDIVSHFGGTRDALYGVFFAVTPQLNSWQKEPKPLADIAAGLGVTAMFPGQINAIMDSNTALLGLACTRMKWNLGMDVCWGNPFNGLGFGFILKAAKNAALMVLKNWIEKNDPNIKLAKHLSFLSQLACVDIPTTATSGLIHATFPFMSTQFTAMYNALGLGDLQGGADSDSDEGEKTKELISSAGLSLPNYCGENNEAAGDLSLDSSAARGERIERVAQLLRKEEEYREAVESLISEIAKKRKVLSALHKEITKQNKILDTHVRNPFTHSTTPVQDENFPDLVQHKIDTSREVTVESRKRLRKERDNLKIEIRALEDNLKFYEDELEFLDENRDEVGDFVR